jgi:hypothetical protein
MSIDKIVEGKNVTIVDKKGAEHTGDIIAKVGDYVHLDVLKYVSGNPRRSTTPIYIKGIKSLIYNN